MSTVQPTDKVLVQRATTLHSAPADMSTVQNTDLILVNRGGVDYKCTVADWRASQGKAPAVYDVKVADSPEAGRFTSGTFNATVAMAEEGNPPAAKGLKAWVEGALKGEPISDEITSVSASVLTLKTNKDLANFAVGDSIKEITAAGAAGDATGTVGSVDATAKTITLSASTGTWDVGSKVEGPPKVVQITPTSDEIVGVSTFAPTVTFVNEHPASMPNGAFDGNLTTTFAGFRSTAGSSMTLTLNGVGADRGLELICAADDTGPTFSVSVNGTHVMDWTPKTNPPAIGRTLSLGNFASVNTIVISHKGAIENAGGGFTLYGVRANGQVLVSGATFLTFKTDKDLANFSAGDAITQAGGGTASGTVASTNATAKTMTLATSTGTWGPANTGKTVVGPSKPAAHVKLYCKLDPTLNVTDLQSPDPGYTAVTGAGPYAVKFPATLPSGNPPDTDLHAGTQLTVEVKATNSAGTSIKHQTITPV